MTNMAVDLCVHWLFLTVNHTVHILMPADVLVVHSGSPNFFCCYSVWYFHAWLYGTYGYVHYQYLCTAVYLVSVSGTANLLWTAVVCLSIAFLCCTAGYSNIPCSLCGWTYYILFSTPWPVTCGLLSSWIHEWNSSDGTFLGHAV